MIYFDNAATTKVKPQCVYDAVVDYMKNIGVSPSRGSYSIGISASRKLYKTRCTLGEYFGAKEKEKVIFTKNSTEAINAFLMGSLSKGDHVIITCYEHNAVLRPIPYLKEQGIIDYSVICRDDLLLRGEDIYKKYAKANTKLLVMTLASNLTGRIVFNSDVCKYFKSKGVKTFVDASQGAGYYSINMQNDGISYLAFTGHKDLLSAPGVGGLCCNDDICFKPFIQGGTGIHGDQYVNPNIFPEGYEAGTLNMPAIWSLKTSIDYLCAHKAEICTNEKKLIEYLLEKLDLLKNVKIYDRDKERTPVCCFNVFGYSSDYVVRYLDSKGVCVRGGIHCAILAHEALSTVNEGAIRVSLSIGNTNEEIDKFVEILKGIQ